jgi:hypothetical protein
MIKYCIFIIFGIILYLLLNTYNGFSIGVPNKYVFNYYYNSEPPYSVNGGLSFIMDPDHDDRDDLLGETTPGEDVTFYTDATNHYREYQVVADNERDADIFFNYYINYINPTDIGDQYRQQLTQLTNGDTRNLSVDEEVEIYTPDYLQNIVHTVGDNPYLGLRLPEDLQDGDFGIIRSIIAIDGVDRTNRFGNLLPFDTVRFANIELYRRHNDPQQVLIDRERILAFVRATNTGYINLTEELQRIISDILDNTAYLVRQTTYQVPIARLRQITNTVNFVQQQQLDRQNIEELDRQHIDEYLQDLEQDTQDLPIMETDDLNAHPRPEQEQRTRNRRRIECATDTTDRV